MFAKIHCKKWKTNVISNILEKKRSSKTHSFGKNNFQDHVQLKILNVSAAPASTWRDLGVQLSVRATVHNYPSVHPRCQSPPKSPTDKVESITGKPWEPQCSYLDYIFFISCTLTVINCLWPWPLALICPFAIATPPSAFRGVIFVSSVDYQILLIVRVIPDFYTN